MEVDLISKKKGHKQNFIRSGSSSISKVVLILLAKVIILYMGSTTIDIR